MPRSNYSIAILIVLAANLACRGSTQNPANNFTPISQEGPLPGSTNTAQIEILDGESDSTSNASDPMVPIVLQVLIGSEATSSNFMPLFPNEQQQEGWQTVIVELALQVRNGTWVHTSPRANLIDSGSYTRSTSTQWGVSPGDGYLGFGSFDYRNLHSAVNYPLIIYSSVPNNQRPETLELSVQDYEGNSFNWQLRLDAIQNIPIPFDNPPTTYAPAGDTYTINFPDAKITYQLNKYFFMESRTDCSTWNAAIVIPVTIENTGGDNITADAFGMELPQSGEVDPIFVTGVDNNGNYITTDLSNRWETINPSGYLAPQWEKGYLAPGESAEFEVVLAWLAYEHPNESEWVWIVIQGIQNEEPVSLRINSEQATDFLCSGWPWGPKDLGQ
jgi:hypothetical protein